MPFVRERWFAGESFGDDLAVLRAAAEHWSREVAGVRTSAAPFGDPFFGDKETRLRRGWGLAAA